MLLESQEKANRWFVRIYTEDVHVLKMQNGFLQLCANHLQKNILNLVESARLSKCNWQQQDEALSLPQEKHTIMPKIAKNS